jgi:hypothetical protein
MNGGRATATSAVRRHGALKPEDAHRLSAEAFAEHGPRKRQPEFRCWQAMIARCLSKTDKDYARYGGRGIRVCRRWLGPAGFWVFVQDMGRRPSPKHSIDRIDGNGNYEPGNCRWATSLEQNNNRCSSHLITINGVERSAADWAREVGLPRQTVTNRIAGGWHPTAAVRGERREVKAAAHARLGVEPLTPCRAVAAPRERSAVIVAEPANTNGGTSDCEELRYVARLIEMTLSPLALEASP